MKIKVNGIPMELDSNTIVSSCGENEDSMWLDFWDRDNNITVSAYGRFNDPNAYRITDENGKEIARGRSINEICDNLENEDSDRKYGLYTEDTIVGHNPDDYSGKTDVYYTVHYDDAYWDKDENIQKFLNEDVELSVMDNDDAEIEIILQRCAIS